MSSSKSATARSPWLVFGVTSLGTFMATLDSSIVNVALPVISSGLGVTLSLVQWVVTAYLLTISSLLPIFGRAGDMYGQRHVYSIGFLIFALSSAACGFADQIYVLIISRVLQAIGAAMLMANGPAIVARAFPPGERGRALGGVGTMVAMGSMVGPSLGGLLTSFFGWEYIFFVNIPIGIAGFFLGYAILPEGERRRDELFDWKGASLFAVGIGSFLLLLSHGEDWGWATPRSIGIGLIAFCSLSLFVWVEKRVDYPMLDLGLFRNWPFLAGNLSGLFSFMAMFSNTILLPFYLSEIRSLTPGQVGLLITPFPLIMAVVAPVSGYLSDRTSPVVLTTAGLTLTTAGLLFLAASGLETPIWHVALAQAVMGFGNGLFQSPNNNSVLSSVDKSKVGVAGGMNALVRNVGMVTGTAVAVSVQEARRRQWLAGLSEPSPAELAGAFLAGYHTALLVGAAFAATAAIISLNRRGHIRAKQEKR